MSFKIGVVVKRMFNVTMTGVIRELKKRTYDKGTESVFEDKVVKIQTCLYANIVC